MLTTDYFKDLPTWELLNFTNKDFYVPTYQRGYRWEENQVKDLLKDLEDFVRSEKEDNYYLQPLVVRPKEWDDENNVKHTGWEVLDGQQRLTTMLLLMKCLNERNSAPAQLYNIFYARHSDLDFQKIVYDTSMGDQNYPNEKKNLDSFFVKKAKNIIQEWYDELKNDSKSSLLDDLRKCLFKEDSQKKVRFIWYDASSEPDFKNMDSIKLFNRLNGGKISLTNSELVKALFYIGFSQCTNSISDKFTFTSEWEIIERKLQDDMFWSFISPRNKYLDTRMDLLLDFTQQTKDNKDKSFSYRRYQTLFDSIFILPTIKEQRDRIKDLWMDIKNQFDTLVRWYENIDMYNYIGYLVECGINIADIQQHLKANLNLRSIIRTKLFRDFD